MVFKIVGGLLVVFGVVDLLGSFLGWDVWGGWFRLELPELLWRFTAWIEIGIGLLLVKLGSADSGEAQQ